MKVFIEKFKIFVSTRIGVASVEICSNAFGLEFRIFDIYRAFEMDFDGLVLY